MESTPHQIADAIATHSAAEAAARHSRGKLVAYLVSRSGDVASAEDALSEAFASALQDWPSNGVPRNPEAWLLTVARRKLIDVIRKRTGEDGPEALESISAVLRADMNEIPDRRLGLLFACAHPSIDPGIRAPLMLQSVLGLDAARIASAFLVSPAAMGQRLVRAKTKIRQTGIPFHVPGRIEMTDRLQAVLDAVYAAFAEGWIDAAGTDFARRELACEAIYLGRLLAELLPAEPEVRGLLALMLYAEARRPARRGPRGEFVPLAQQDVSLWDSALIDEAEAALRQGAAAGQIGRYQLEAAIQSAHNEGRRTGRPNWIAILGFYDALAGLTGSPVVLLNRAVALAALEGPAAGLAALDRLNANPRMTEYQPYWAARADLLARAGNRSAARHAYEIAIGLERDPPVREFLEGRRAALDQ